MWRLLAAELHYNRTVLAVTLGLVVTLLVLAVGWGSMNIYQFMGTSMLSYIAIGIIGGESDKEKRDRLFASLPVGLMAISFSRMAFILVYQGVLVLIWVAGYLLNPVEPASSFAVGALVYNGAALIIFMVFVLAHDFRYHRLAWLRFLFWICIPPAFFLLFAVGPRPVFTTAEFGVEWTFYKIFRHTLPGAVLVNLVAAGLIALGTKVFTWRTSFLE